VSQPLLNIPLQRLLEYTNPKQVAGEIRALKVSTLTGGYVAAGVYRLDVEFSNGTSSFVQKQTYANEIHVMNLLTKHIVSENIPALIDSHIDDEQPQQNGTSWFISPFYEGHTLDFDDDIPLSIVKTLATVHACFAKHLQDLDTLTKVDAEFISRLLNLILAASDQNQGRFPAAFVAELRDKINTSDFAATLGKVFERLPKTLTHGDVHAGNIIHTADDKHILFDWGNARFAPAMLDLANMVNKDSDEWRAYLACWKEITGEALDPETAQMGYDWAVAVVNLQYLPFALGYLEPDAAQNMLNKVTDAIAALQKSL
jgi:thiamine kinase-like enzyme